MRHVVSCQRWPRLFVAFLCLVVPAALQAQAGGTLRGTVTLEQTGDAVPGAVVAVAGRSTTTDALGAFEIAGLPSGEHVVHVTHAPMGAAVSDRVRIDEGAVRGLDPVLPLPVIHEAVTVEGIDVRTLVPAGIEGTPGAAATLTAAEIRHYRPYSIHDALQLLPGVRTIDDDALGRRSGIGVRGSPPRRSRRVLLLEDGVPINAATYLDPSAHYTPPLERLDHIDVLKGAGQIVHGPLNNHGIINFRTAQPTLVPETVVEGALGTTGTARRHVLHTRTAGRAGLVLAYSGMNADGVFDSESHRYDDLFGSVALSLGARQEIGASLTYFRERSHYDERNLSLADYEAHPRSKLRLNQGAEFNTMAIDYLKGHLTHRLQVAERLTLTSHVFGTDLDRPRFESRRGGPEATGGYMRGRERDYRTGGGATRLEWPQATFGPVHATWETGLRWERQLLDNRNTVGAVGDLLDEGNRGQLAPRDSAMLLEDGRRESLKASAASGYIQSSLRAGRVTLVPGVRVERYTQSRTIRFRAGSDVDDRASDARTLVLPGVGLHYAVEPATQIYAGVHRGYSPAIARTEDFPLVPETGVDAQAGLRSRRVPGVMIDLAGFWNRLENTLVKKTFTDAFGASVFVNSGDSRVRGVDAGLRVDSQTFTGSRLNVFVHAVYSLADAQFTSGPVEGNRVPEVSRTSGRISTGVVHAAGWSASMTISRVGAFFTDEANTEALSVPDPAEPLEVVGIVPAHTVVSARGSWRVPGTRFTVWVQGRNLGNRLYVSDVQDGLRPGPGRTVRAGVRAAF